MLFNNDHQSTLDALLIGTSLEVNSRNHDLGGRCIRLCNVIDNIDDFIVLHRLFLEGKLFGSFDHFGPLCDGIENYRDKLLAMLDLGFITKTSQVGHINDDDHTRLYGYGFVTGFLPKSLLGITNKMLKRSGLLVIMNGKAVILGTRILVDLSESEKEVWFSCLGDNDRNKKFEDLIFKFDGYGVGDNLSLSNIPYSILRDIGAVELGEYREAHNLHDNVSDHIKENYVDIEFVYPKFGDHDIFDRVLTLLTASRINAY